VEVPIYSFRCLERDASNAMNPFPNYSAGYLSLRTDCGEQSPADDSDYESHLRETLP
jgi:hypothetical protein